MVELVRAGHLTVELEENILMVKIYKKGDQRSHERKQGVYRLGVERNGSAHTGPGPGGH